MLQYNPWLSYDGFFIALTTLMKLGWVCFSDLMTLMQLSHGSKIYINITEITQDFFCWLQVRNKPSYAYLYPKIKINGGFWHKQQILPIGKFFLEIGPIYLTTICVNVCDRVVCCLSICVLSPPEPLEVWKHEWYHVVTNCQGHVLSPSGLPKVAKNRQKKPKFAFP